MTLLPQRDRQMFVILMGVMLAADLAAAATGRAWDRWPAFVIMPGSLLLVWLSYQVSLVAASRLKRATPEALDALSRFMGRTLSLAGAVVTIGHLGLAAFAARWIENLDMEAFLRLFMSGMSVMLIMMHNRMPKMLMAYAPPGLARWYLRASWLGVACGTGMIVIAWSLPVGQMTYPFLTVALIPTAAYLGGLLIWRFGPGRTR